MDWSGLETLSSANFRFVSKKYGGNDSKKYAVLCCSSTKPCSHYLIFHQSQVTFHNTVCLQCSTTEEVEEDREMLHMTTLLH